MLPPNPEGCELPTSSLAGFFWCLHFWVQPFNDELEALIIKWKQVEQIRGETWKTKLSSRRMLAVSQKFSWDSSDSDLVSFLDILGDG